MFVAFGEALMHAILSSFFFCLFEMIDTQCEKSVVACFSFFFFSFLSLEKEMFFWPGGGKGHCRYSA